MDHREAARSTAVERYLLGELPDAQREDFEEHFFSCAECSEQVRMGAVFRANARAVVKEAGSLDAIPHEGRQPWFGWNLRPAFGLATAVLALLVGYQNLIEIPHLRQSAGAETFSAAEATETAAVRGEDDHTYSRKTPAFTIVVRHEWQESYSGYAFDLVGGTGSEPVHSARLGNASRDLSVTIRPAALDAGKYMLNVYGERADGQKTAVARIPLTLTE